MKRKLPSLPLPPPDLLASDATWDDWVAVATSQAREKRRRRTEPLDWPMGDYQLKDVVTHELTRYLPFHALLSLGKTCRAFSRLWRGWVHTIVIDNHPEFRRVPNRVPRLTRNRLALFPNVQCLVFMSSRSSRKRVYQICSAAILKMYPNLNGKRFILHWDVCWQAANIALLKERGADVRTIGNRFDYYGL